MRTVVSVAALALFALTTPASARMCGAGKQAQTSSNAMSSGMMCGAPQAADDPMADKPTDKSKASGMMCPCCRNMAMMRSGMGAGGMQHNMPGMDMPKQQ